MNSYRSIRNQIEIRYIMIFPEDFISSMMTKSQIFDLKINVYIPEKFRYIDYFPI